MDSRRRRALRQKYIHKRLQQLHKQSDLFDPETADLLHLEKNRLSKTSVTEYKGRRLHRKGDQCSASISVVQDIIAEQRKAFYHGYGDQEQADYDS